MKRAHSESQTGEFASETEDEFSEISAPSLPESNGCRGTGQM